MKTCKRQRLLAMIVCACVLAVAMAVLSRYVAVGWGGNDAGACLSFALDKRAVKSVDRVVLRVGDSAVESTDPELVEQLKDELLVAAHTDLRVYHPNYGKSIEFYCGDRLVRSMRWGGDGDVVEVYVHDEAHKVLFSMEKQGLVFLSEETAARLDELVSALEDAAARK